MSVKEKLLRSAIVAQCRALNASGLNQGMAGNISARLDDALVITPSAIPYDVLRPEMLAVMPLSGEYGAWSGPLKPSSEWRFHLDIMRARPDIGAIVHSHPPYCTTLAMLNRPILAAHYMIALFGGPVIECAKYAPYGTKELSDVAIAALGDRHGALLGNHGAIATGATLESAMYRAVEMEALARMYYLAIAVGRPAILSDEEVARIVERFKTYGGGIDAPKAQPPIKKRARGKAAATKRGAKKKATRKKASGAVARK
ncbi:MAG: class II aldolase/adducin family protein [Roseiarcus sp.]